MKVLPGITDNVIRKQIEGMVSEFNRSSATPVFGDKDFTNPGGTGKVMVEFQVSETSGATVLLLLNVRVTGVEASGDYGVTNTTLGDAICYASNAGTDKGNAVLMTVLKKSKGTYRYEFTTSAAGNCTMKVEWVVIPFIPTV